MIEAHFARRVEVARVHLGDLLEVLDRLLPVGAQDQARLDGSTFFNTGALSHELKFGFGYRVADVDSTYTVRLVNERGLRYLMSHPGDLGFARAYVAGDLALRSGATTIKDVSPDDPQVNVMVYGVMLSLSLAFGDPTNLADMFCRVEAIPRTTVPMPRATARKRPSRTAQKPRRLRPKKT